MMRKLGLIALAASAAWVSPANAQTVPDPDLSYGAPDLRLAIPAAAAAAASAAASISAPASASPSAMIPMMSRGAAQMGHRGPQMRHSAPQMRHSMPKMRHSMPQMRHQGPKFHGPKMSHQGPKYHGSKMRHHGPKMRHDFKMGHYGKGGKHFSGKNFRHHRIDRGGSVSSFWWGPQYHVQNWGYYGFPEPGYDRRWVRYYDDALLIDRDGRVHDGRYGWDWDRYGERWDYDDRGVPGYAYDDEYRGDDDYDADERDHDWAEKDKERGDRREDHAYGPPPSDCSAPCTRVYRGPPPPPHFYRYGYGYGCCGPVTVTETITTTTTAPVVETRTYYVKHKAKPRHHVRKPVRRAPPPPKPGERG
jgi:Ni/Co efflux regulator RcnB